MQQRSILSGTHLLSKLLGIFVLPAALLLGLFTLRRVLFLVVALFSSRLDDRRPSSRATNPGRVLLLVPFHNEAPALPALLRSLRRLHYPSQLLHVVLVDDGSTDGSVSVCRSAVAQRSNWHLLQMPRRVGKASALNAALARFPRASLVAVYDADDRPQPEALDRLVACFEDSRVGAASGRRAVANPLATPVATYVTYETLVHQLVTMQAKDALHLAPAVLGSNCVYRRAALRQAGGFHPGALLEDSDLTVKLARAGWRLRFVPGAVSRHAAPETVGAYWRQHTRWATGFQDVARRQALSVLRTSSLPRGLRLELLLFSSGYADRLALAFLALVWALHPQRRSRTRRLLLATFVPPFLQTVTALHLAQAPPALWRRLPLLPLFFFVDVTMAAAGILRSVGSTLPVGIARSVILQCWSILVAGEASCPTTQGVTFNRL